MTATMTPRDLPVTVSGLLTVEIVDGFGEGIPGERVTATYAGAGDDRTRVAAVTDASGRAHLRAPGEAHWLTVAHGGEVLRARPLSGAVVIER